MKNQRTPNGEQILKSIGLAVTVSGNLALSTSQKMTPPEILSILHEAEGFVMNDVIRQAVQPDPSVKPKSRIIVPGMRVPPGGGNGKAH